MNPQPIELIAPTSRSWAGMRRVLFQPFDIKKWFVLGFTAWLAQLLENSGSPGSANSNNSSSNQTNANEQFHELLDWIKANIELVITVASIVAIMGLAITVALIWVRSRGKLMFLDNVLYNRALVKQPWAQYRELGNSLFRWNLVFGAVVLVGILIFGGAAGWFIFSQIQANIWTGGSTLIVVGIGLVMFAVALVLAYISVLLEDFVVPVMYKHGLSTNDAWRKFLPIHRQALGWFILYALWKLLLGLGVVVAIVLIGIATCCIGFIPLIIPYLGVIILLPVYVFFRFLGPEFLRQFGRENDLWHLDADVADTPPS